MSHLFSFSPLTTTHAGMSLRVIWLHQESKSHFGFPWVCPWDNRDKFYMDGKRIQCLSNALQHVPIYLQPFPSNWTRKFAILAHFLHILAASPGYAPGTIAVNVTWIEREFNACQTPRSMYPFIFNHFPVIEPENSKVRHFSTFWYVLASPGYSPGTIAVNVTWIEREFNACQMPRSMYPYIFNCFPVIQAVSLKVGHCSTFFGHFCLPGYAPGTIAVNVTRL